MLKRDEMLEVESCWNKAKPNERVFVLLARDVAAPETIRFWAHHRVALGKNKPDDPQIVEAELCATLMENERTGTGHKVTRTGSGECNDGSIGYALSQLKAGKQVRRSCWHHQHIYLEMHGPNITLHSYGQEKQVWCANQDDLLADDWEIAGTPQVRLSEEDQGKLVRNELCPKCTMSHEPGACYAAAVGGSWVGETRPSAATLHAMHSKAPASLYDDAMVRGLASAAVSPARALTKEETDAVELARKIGLVPK